MLDNGNDMDLVDRIDVLDEPQICTPEDIAFSRTAAIKANAGNRTPERQHRGAQGEKGRLTQSLHSRVQLAPFQHETHPAITCKQREQSDRTLTTSNPRSTAASLPNAGVTALRTLAVA